MSKLTALAVNNAKPGRHADGKGLYLLVKDTGAKSWLLRVQVDGKRRDIGLGSVATPSAQRAKKVDAEEAGIVIPLLHRKVLTLSEAREKAGLLRTAAKSGLDPVAERDRERKSIPTFKAAAKSAHEALKAGWTEKEGKAFLASLDNHAHKTLGSMRVDKITAADITDALAPIWTSKPDIAKKVRQRISKVLNFAHGKGWRIAEAPSKSVSVGLPRQPKGGNFKASRHPSGRHYSWTSEMPPAPAPAALLEIVRREHVSPTSAGSKAPARELVSGGCGADTTYGLAALDAECGHIRSAGDGEQESALNEGALKIGALVAGGELLIDTASPS